MRNNNIKSGNVSLIISFCLLWSISSSIAKNIEKVQMDLDPGKFTVAVRIEDQNSEKIVIYKSRFLIKGST